MTGKYGDIVLERKQVSADAFEEQVSVASRKVPAANALPEKNVAGHNGFFIEEMYAETPRTVSRHVVDSHWCTEKFSGTLLVKQDVGFEWIDLEFEPKAAEELGIAHHRSGLGMHGCLAFLALNDCRGVSDVIKVAMRYYQEIDLLACEGRICPLRGVEKDAASRCLVVETIGVEHTARKGFEPIHEKMVREKMM
jgi:hypothetical protein